MTVAPRARSALAAMGIASGVLLAGGALGPACSSPSTGGYLLYTDASAGLGTPP